MISEVIKDFEFLMQNLPDTRVNLDQAQELAVKFLKASAKANRILWEVRNERVVDRQARGIQLTIAGNATGEKTQAAKDRGAELNPDYQAAEKRYQESKNKEEYLVNIFTIFNNAHIYYKGLAKEL